MGVDHSDKALLESFKTYLGVGKIYKHSSTSVQYEVKTVNELEAIISHFDKYPLITKKRLDFDLFKFAVNCLRNKEHLNKEGFEKLLSIKASVNKGLSPRLQASFPHITPVIRGGTVEIPVNLDPN